MPEQSLDCASHRLERPAPAEDCKREKGYIGGAACTVGIAAVLDPEVDHLNVVRLDNVEDGRVVVHGSVHVRFDFLLVVVGEVIADLHRAGPGLDGADETLQLKFPGAVGAASDELVGLGETWERGPNGVFVILFMDYSVFGSMFVFFGSLLVFRFMLALVGGIRLVGGDTFGVAAAGRLCAGALFDEVVSGNGFLYVVVVDLPVLSKHEIGWLRCHDAIAVFN